MKVFWVLAWDHYYPEGGLRNVVGTFATKTEADEFAAACKGYDCVEVENVSALLF